MGMAYFDKINPSIYGRRFGLQSLSSSQYGGSVGRIDLLIGAEDVKKRSSTADTTSTNIAAFGVSVLDNSSAGSSQVFTMDPPIIGVSKTLIFRTTANTIYVKTANSEQIHSTQGTSNTVVKSTNLVAGSVTLTPLSTAAWAVQSMSSAVFAMSTTT